MKLTEKLLGYLNRWVFDTSPDQFLAMRVRYDGSMSWVVYDGVLTFSVVGGSGVSLTVNLADYTLEELAMYLSLQSGYAVPFIISDEWRMVKATVLLDGSGEQDADNGDHLYGYQSIAYAYIEAYGIELDLARTASKEAVKQISSATASNEWVDEVGGFYGVRRQSGETDPDYADRIIYEVVRPRNNNKAIEVAISKATGGLPSTVTDVSIAQNVFPVRDGVALFNGVRTHSHTGKYLRNLFDVNYQFNLEGSDDVTDFKNKVLDLIDRFRSAGNNLRQIASSGGTMVDDATYELTESLSSSINSDMIDSYSAALTDSMDTYATTLDVMLDSVSASSDDADLALTNHYLHNGSILRGGGSRMPHYDSGITLTETL